MTAAPPEPPAPAVPPAPADPAQATLQRLLERMQARADFPALSARVQAIQRMASSEHEPLHRLADEILQDVALTQKLLRLVNSAHFRREGQTVATVTRAVALVGLAGIRNLALSLVLVEHMSDRAHAQRLKQAFARALLAGQLAHELAPSRREAEEVFLAALFQNLGALVAEVYFPDEAQQVRARLAEARVRRALLPGQPGTPEPPHDARAADRLAEQLLGLDFDALGTAVARLWGLPEDLLAAMARPDGASPGRLLAPGPQQRRWLGVASNEAASALWTLDPRRVPEALAQVVQRHGRALGLDSDELRRAAEQAWRTLASMAPALGLQLPRAVPLPAARAGAPSGPGRAAVPGAAGLGAAGLGAAEVGPAAAAAALPTAEATAAAVPRTALALLSAGIQDVATALASEQAPLQQVMQMVLETIYRALGCRRVVFCLREADGSRLVGRLALGLPRTAGAGPATVQLQLRPPAGQVPDALAAACLAGEDVWAAPFHAAGPVPPGAAAAAGPGWPAWLLAEAPGACFSLPLHLRGQPLALIHAEHDAPDGWDEAERALLRTLRSQALLALRPAG